MLACLEGVLRVVQAVHSDVVLQRGGGDGPEDGQLQPLGGGLADGLAHQAVGAQGLGEDVAGLLVHLDVAGSGEVLLPHHHHLLKGGDMASRLKGWINGSLRTVKEINL